MGEPIPERRGLLHIPEVMPTPVSSAPPLIFVVDDDRAALRALTLLVRSFGWSVQGFGSAAACLSAALQQRPDCIIADLDMPHMNGVQVIAALAAKKANIPVIIVAQVPEGSASIVQAWAAGTATVLAKPYSNTLLHSAVQQAIKSASDLQAG